MSILVSPIFNIYLSLTSSSLVRKEWHNSLFQSLTEIKYRLDWVFPPFSILLIYFVSVLVSQIVQGIYFLIIY